MHIATVSTSTRKFYKDVMKGLRSSPKYLESKYFYDERGDELFQQIMNCDEYYLTNCEMEILQRRSGEIASAIFKLENNFDVIELGAGDCSKSIHLLKEIFKTDSGFTYFPVDISKHVIGLIEEILPDTIDGLHIHGLNGEYIEMLKRANEVSARKKLVFFMGSNIGNMTQQEAIGFCAQVRSCLQPGDCLLIGFDLKKDPQVILNAYNDKQGITREFNLNLLRRINRELNGNFVLEHFKHFPVYNPESGECKSYLISQCRQRVFIGDTEFIDLDEYETIHMEISAKYSVAETDSLAALSGFEAVKHFYDSRQWFVDALWKCI